MNLYRIYHQYIERLAGTDFWLLESSIWLHTLGRSLITLFIPILMVRIGYGIGEVVLYFFIYNVIDVPLNFLARWATRKFGARKVMFVATFFTIAFFVTLYNLAPASWSLLILLAVFAAIYDTLYWVSHLYLFIESSDKVKSVGKNTGILRSIKRTASVLGPAIGAAVLIFVSQGALIITSIVVFILSLAPLVWVDEFPDKPKQRQLSFKQFFKPKEEKRDFLTIAGYSVHDLVESNLFPLFIFITFGTLESVAGVAIILTITGILSPLFLGRIKSKDRSKLIALGAFLIAVVWLFRIVMTDGLFYYISVLLVSLFILLINVPMDINIFTRGKERDALSASMYRNVVFMFTNMIVWGVLALVINVFQVGFISAFIAMVALVGVNGVFWMGERKSSQYPL